MKDRKIDGLIWVGGLPTAAITDLATTPGITVKLIDHAEYADDLNKKWGPLYVKGKIPASTYKGQDKDNANLDVWNLLVADQKMSDDMAYTIVKTLFEKQGRAGRGAPRGARTSTWPSRRRPRRSRCIRARASTSKSAASSSRTDAGRAVERRGRSQR